MGITIVTPAMIPYAVGENILVYIGIKNIAIKVLEKEAML